MAVKRSAKVRIPHRLLTVTVTEGDLAGAVLSMRMAGLADIQRLQELRSSAGTKEEPSEQAQGNAFEALNLVMKLVVSHNLDGDIGELEPEEAQVILGAWSKAVKEAALPKETATS
jgi:hypothetical protein